jgi:hypothetical protein
MTTATHTISSSSTHDRTQFLYGDKRDSVLSLADVHEYGRENFDDPDFLSLYGMTPAHWYARGIRLLGRTAIECTRDILAQRIGTDLADVARHLPQNVPLTVVDPFAGSGNTLYWVVKSLPGSSGVGFEQHAKVSELTSTNLRVLNANLRMEQKDFNKGLTTLSVPRENAIVIIVSPPWGRALDPEHGLDLLKTTPPVPTVLDSVQKLFPDRKLILAVQTFETMVGSSVEQVRRHFKWSTVHTYGFNPSGKNSGLLIGTMGWKP